MPTSSPAWFRSPHHPALDRLLDAELAVPVSLLDVLHEYDPVWVLGYSLVQPF
jgi:hypothetical protein